MTPQDILVPYYGSQRSYKWCELDPAKAAYGATWGLRGPHGTTYLLIPNNPYPDWSHCMVAVGQFSGLFDMATGEGLQSIANDIESNLKAHPGNLDIDRKIKKAEFESWKVG